MMRPIKFKGAASLILAVTTAFSCVAFSACKDDNTEKTEKPEYAEITQEDFLTAEGELVKKFSGETVSLRGVNAGGLFVTEHWMTGFERNTQPNNDYKSLTKTFIERFGEESTKALWAEYRANWWSDIDFKNCADMGMNVIRLPFTYMNVDFGAVADYERAGNYDFSALDEFVDKASKYGMYTILDLHGAYGSQSGQDHTGEILDYREVDFYSNEEMQTLTLNLWSALSEHYKDEPAVAGYDILNEPGERKGNGSDGVMNTEKRHWDFFDKVYDAIRATGDEHMIIIESCWDGKDLPKTSAYGWENCMYSFHHYTSNTDTSEEGIRSHNASWDNKVSEVNSQKFGVPLQMGEFTAYTSPEKWDHTLGLLNDSGWHWTSWTYKVWGRMPWGIYNVNGGVKVDANADSYYDILESFKQLRTDGGYVNKYAFNVADDDGNYSQRTLESIFAQYCVTAEKDGGDD